MGVPMTRAISLTIASAAIAIGMAGGAAADSEDTGGALPKAETWRPHGVNEQLLGLAGDRSARVRVLMREQPVLEAASRPAFEAAVDVAVDARSRARSSGSAEITA